MEKQNYHNHKKYYVPHHFIFYPIAACVAGISVYGISHYSNTLEWIVITALSILVIFLSVMMRQHYGLGLQDRMVRVEMRLRYYQLTQRRLEFIEYKLSFKQLAALRFASDDQLPGLINEVIEEKLTPAQIKKRIRNWLPDTMRV